MARQDYTEDQLFELGKNSYDKLVLHCKNLEMAGFWDKAQQVMQRSSSEVLDLYVQAVLMKLAKQCGEILESQLRFILKVTCSNPLGISEDMTVDGEFLKDVEHIYNMPPIIIQLCSLHDTQNSDDMTAYFVDALLNILLCMAYLNQGKDPEVSQFIKEYYEKIDYYIGGRDATAHTRYIMHKINNSVIECDVDAMKEEEKQRSRAAAAAVAGSKTAVAAEGAVAGNRAAMAAERTAGDGAAVAAENMAGGAVNLPAGKESPEEIEKRDSGEVQAEEERRRNEEQARRKEMQRKCEQIKKEQELNRARRQRRREENRRIREENERLRAEEERKNEEQAREMFLEMKQRILEREQAEAREQEMRLKALVEELNALVGLGSVKEEIRSLVNLIKVRKMRESMNLPAMDMSYHMVFTGSPGTGKTTVARLVAKIYKELGILSEGNLVETDRSGLVAGYVGQTAIKVHEIVEQAIGGVLFIDEAYALANPDVPNDFGTEAIDTLVKLMEDHRDNLVIIVAGYTEEMQNFLKSNTGLISRFNKFVDFPDYTLEELVEIMDVTAQNAGLIIDDEAKASVLKVLKRKKVEEWKAFGNARGIRNLFEKLVVNQANRIVTLENPGKVDLITIKKEDVQV